MEQSSDTCGAVRPGYSATFNACMRGAGHDGVHISALGAKWPTGEAATRRECQQIRPGFGEGCEA